MTEAGDGCGRGLVRFLGMTIAAVLVVTLLARGAPPRPRRPWARRGAAHA